MRLVNSILDYYSWADGTIWNIVQNLSDEEFDRDFSQNTSSIRKRYTHLAQDIWEWYHDWTGIEPDEEPEFGRMSPKELFDMISEYTEQLIEMLDEPTMQESSFDTETSTVDLNIKEFIFHLANHATYHRGQIVMCLRMLGKEVPMTDYVPYRINTSA